MTGKTTTDYINGTRLEKAIYYLEKSELNITEIALSCGFDSVNYFSRYLKGIIVFHQQNIKKQISCKK